MLTTLQLFGMAGLAIVGVWLMILVTFTLLGRRTISIPRPQYNIIRFMSAIVGGIAGFLFAYDLKVDVLGNIESNLRLALTSGGGAGAAFALVFLFYPRFRDQPPTTPPPPPTTISMDIPSSWTFEQAVLGIAKVARCTADCDAFSDEDRGVKLASEAHIVASDMNAALLQLRKFLPARLKSYSIHKDTGLNHYSVSP